MRKKLLIAIALLVSGVGNLWAQTDVTSRYMTNPSFEAANATTGDISATGVFTNDWNIITISHARVAVFNAESEVYTYGSTSPSDGYYYLMIRSNASESKTQTIRQNTDMALPKGKYSIFFDYKAARSVDVTRNFSVSAVSSDASTTFGKKQVAIPKVSANSTYFAENPWSTGTFDFTLENTTNVRINIACETRPSHTVVLFDNFVIKYTNINKETLAYLIAQATSINSIIGTLTTEIATAQSVYDEINDSPDYQDDIDGAISSLRSAINTKVAEYSYNPAGHDISAFIQNNGFETSPIFDGTSLGSGSAPKSNAEPMTGSTLLSGAVNVYNISGWNVGTTETSDYARLFTMPFDKTLYVKSNGADGGQAIASPANGSSVTTSNNSLLMIQTSWCNNVENTLSQTIPLPAGSYRLTFDSYVSTTISNASSRCGISYGTTPTTAYRWPEATDTWTANSIDFVLEELTDVTISFGYKKTAEIGAGSTPMLFVDNVKLTYFDPLKLAQIQWQAVHDALAALDATALPDAAEAAITTELTKAVPTTTVDEVNAAKADLQALIDSYDGIKAAYESDKDFITAVTEIVANSAGDKATINTAISTATTSIETRTTAADLATDYSTLETALHTYVISGAEPAAGYPFEVTFKIVNPSFEDDKKETSAPAGWTIPNKGNQYGAKAKGSMSNVEGNYYFNNWQSWWMDCNVEQTISSLPNGRYEVTAVLASYNGTSANLQAGSGSTDTNMTGENNGIRVSVNGDVTGSSLTIRARAGRKNDGSLLRVDDFTLSFIGLKPVLSDLITSATALTTTNVGDEAFQIPSSAASTLSDAIGDAQTVYENDDAYGDAIQTAINNLNTAIEAFQGAALVAPSESTPYNLYLSDGGSYAKTLTFKDGNPSAGTYAIGLTEDAGSAFNQAVHFKAVDGETNQYNIYIEDASGTKHYLCTGLGGGYASGTTEQIRVTTTEANALAVLLVASNTEDGVYYLKNTESSNALIGTSDGGFYTTTKYNKFNINAAAECEVPVAINSGKWGTRIFPFEVSSIPDGLEAYTTSSVSGSSIVLSDALSSIPANTPVLLKASKDVDTSVSGYGVAKTSDYTTGLLTGVYTTASIAASVEPGAETAGKYRYVLQTPTTGENEGKQAFYKVTSAFTATAYRCYLSVDIPATGEGVKAFYLDGDETAVSSVKADELQGATIYNLAGQRVSKAQKGVYIINGKKVAVK